MTEAQAAAAGASAGPRSRAAWGVADQATSSFTQLAVAVLAARSLSPEEFGGFAAAIAIYLLALAVGRAVCGEVLTVRHAGLPARTAAPAAMGAAIVVGAALGVGGLVAAIVVGGSFGSSATVVSIALPMLLLQDAVRYVWAALGRPAGAFIVDVAWVVLLAVGTGVVAQADDLTATWISVVWASAGVASALVGVAALRVAPAPLAAAAWLRGGWDLGSRFAVELVVTQGAGQLLVAGFGLVAGAADAGALRGVQVLFGPLIVLLVGIRFVAVPEGAHLAEHALAPGRAIVRRSSQLSALFVTAAVAVLVVLALLPDAVGEAVLGETWPATEDLIVPWGVFMGWQALVESAAIGLRSLAAASRSLRAALTGTLVVVTAGVAGAAAGGVEAGTWVLAGAGAVSAAIWWRQLVAAAQSAPGRADR